MLGVAVLILVGVLLAGIGIALITNFRDASTWWKGSAPEYRSILPGHLLEGRTERSAQLIVGGAFLLFGIATVTIQAPVGSQT